MGWDSWHAVRINMLTDQAELLSHLLHEAGSSGIVEEDDGAEGSVQFTAYFSAEREDTDSLRLRLGAILETYPSLGELKFAIVTAGAGEWKKDWRQWFKPFAIVPDIMVAPSWEKFECKAGEEVITLDPGMAFGTGLHETTRLCAETIHELVRKKSGDRISSLLDVGTGSGLLCIVARKLGIERISAVDNDPDAVTVARENFEINGVQGAELSGALASIRGKFDVVVANILMLTVIELKSALIDRLAPRGTLILSGITHDQEERIERNFSPPLTLFSARRMGEWSSMTFRKKGD